MVACSVFIASEISCAASRENIWVQTMDGEMWQFSVDPAVITVGELKQMIELEHSTG